jgi:transaldolase
MIGGKLTVANMSMTRPSNLKTKIFLDSGDPAETRAALDLLGFLDGQTTNPTLIARNPEAQARLAKGDRFTDKEVYDFYRQVVAKISRLLPEGSVSIEAYADDTTSAQAMVAQAREMDSWIPNAHIKLPIIQVGMQAAEELVKDGIRLNMTLCFSQAQAAAVAAATPMAAPGQVFVSPFVGRLEAVGRRGLDLVANCRRMYAEQSVNVEVLSASVRTLDHLLASLAFGADIVTAPIKTLREWAGRGMPVPDEGYRYEPVGLEPIPYETMDLMKRWDAFDLRHELTDQGLRRFADDWNGLIARQ